MLTLAVRTAGPSDRAPVAGTLASAFATGPVADWLMPVASARLDLYLEYARALYDDAIVHGTVYTADSYVAAAVWYPHDAVADLDSVAEVLVEMAGFEVAQRFGQLDAAMAAVAPAESHQHLAFLGVYPTLQRRGIGTALLRHHHHQLDQTGQAAFLVATSAGSRDLYLRHGYRVLDEVALPAGPPLWPMWRAAGER